jgi:hypothetical protein
MRHGVLLLVILLGACTGVFLYPSREQVLHPQQLGLAYEDVFLQGEGGARLHGWYLPAVPPVRGTVLHLHGNAQNISTFISVVRWLPARGYNVFLVDYRGYGLSEGAASVRNVHADARLALDYLLARPGADGERLAVFGQSLGASVAIYTVAHHPQRTRVRAVVAEGAFSSYSRIAREKMGRFWLTWPLQYPLSLLFRSEFDAERAVGSLSPVPLLLVSGDADKVVPAAHGRRLFDAAREPREIWSVAGGVHVDTFTRPEWRERLVGYFEKTLPH